MAKINLSVCARAFNNTLDMLVLFVEQEGIDSREIDSLSRSTLIDTDEAFSEVLNAIFFLFQVALFDLMYIGSI